MTHSTIGHVQSSKRRVHMFRYAVGAAALALAIACADPAAAQRVRAGVLTCDISAGMSFIIGSQKSVACTFAPEPPGPQQVYNGSISKFGLDVGAPRGGGMGWGGVTGSIAPPGARLLSCGPFRVTGPGHGAPGA